MNYDDWKSTEPDNRYNDDRLIATCVKCGDRFPAEDAEEVCPWCWKKQQEHNETVYLRAVKAWFQKTEAS